MTTEELRGKYKKIMEDTKTDILNTPWYKLKTIDRLRSRYRWASHHYHKL
jgi:hypothetical protein